MAIAIWQNDLPKTLRPELNSHPFADKILQTMHFPENLISWFKFHWMFVPKRLIDNKPTLVQVMALLRQINRRHVASVGLNELRSRVIFAQLHILVTPLIIEVCICIHIYDYVLYKIYIKKYITIPNISVHSVQHTVQANSIKNIRDPNL